MEPLNNLNNSSLNGSNWLVSGMLMANTSGTTGITSGQRPYARSGIVIIIVILFFVLGVLGNFLALLILARKRATKNSKYTLMLRCLATNNLIGLMGMLTQLLLKLYLPTHIVKEYVRWNCIGMVIWRFFGLSSGCIAAVMAIERWMALARPFTYHTHITYNVVRKTINGLVSVATVITFLPFFGFGTYFDEENRQCQRYRNAVTLWDKSYAVLFMAFGTLLCVVIVVCNLFVTRVLCFIGRSKTNTRSVHYDLVNRERGKDTVDSLYHSNGPISTSSSPDEIKFAKLMAFLSISFVVCWMPQMISIPFALKPNPLPKNHWFFRVADILMALHFTSDPYVYVLSRTKQPFLLGFIKRWRTGLKRTQSDQSRLRPTIDNTTEYGLNT